MGQALKQFSISVARFSGEDQRVAGSDQFVQSCEGLCAATEAYLAQAKDVELKLKELHEELNIVRKDIIERDRLALSYDQTRHDLAAEQKKPNPVPQNLQLKETKMQNAKENFESKNKSVIAQISDIYYNRTIHDQMQTFVSTLANFFSAASTAFSSLAANMSQLSPPSAAAMPRPSAAKSSNPPPSAPAPKAAASTAPISTPVSTPTPASNVAPTPAPSVQRPAGPVPEQVEAVFPFKAESGTELEFLQGAIITVKKRDHPDWWVGELNGKIGEFPSNYVKPLNFTV